MEFGGFQSDDSLGPDRSQSQYLPPKPMMVGEHTA